MNSESRSHKTPHGPRCHPGTRSPSVTAAPQPASRAAFSHRSRVDGFHPYLGVALKTQRLGKHSLLPPSHHLDFTHLNPTLSGCRWRISATVKIRILKVTDQEYFKICYLSVRHDSEIKHAKKLNLMNKWGLFSWIYEAFKKLPTKNGDISKTGQ